MSVTLVQTFKLPRVLCLISAVFKLLPNSWQHLTCFTGLLLSCGDFFSHFFFFVQPIFKICKTLNLYSLQNICTTDTKLATEHLQTILCTRPTLIFGYTKSSDLCRIAPKKGDPTVDVKLVDQYFLSVHDEKMTAFWCHGRGYANITILCSKMNICLHFVACFSLKDLVNHC